MRAFLEASDIVEIDEEVLDDILDGFSGFDVAGDDMAASETIDHLQKGKHVNAAENNEFPLPHGFYIYFGPQGRSSSHMIRECSFPESYRVRTNDPSLDETTNQWDACPS